MHLHDPENISFEEGIAPDGPLEAMRALQEEGVIAHLGVAGGPIDLMQRYIRTGAFAAVLTHNRYTLVDTSAEPLIAEAQERGVAVLNAAPFGGGVLAGGRASEGTYAYRDAAPEELARIEAIQRGVRAPRRAGGGRRAAVLAARPADRLHRRRRLAGPSGSRSWSSSPATPSRGSCGTS